MAASGFVISGLSSESTESATPFFCDITRAQLPKLQSACRFRAVHNNAVVFKGIIDEYSISIDEKGSVVTLSGRSDAALLLDNELPAQECSLHPSPGFGCLYPILCRSARRTATRSLGRQGAAYGGKARRERNLHGHFLALLGRLPERRDDSDTGGVSMWLSEIKRKAEPTGTLPDISVNAAGDINCRLPESCRRNDGSGHCLIHIS